MKISSCLSLLTKFQGGDVTALSDECNHYESFSFFHVWRFIKIHRNRILRLLTIILCDHPPHESENSYFKFTSSVSLSVSLHFITVHTTKKKNYREKKNEIHFNEKENAIQRFIMRGKMLTMWKMFDTKIETFGLFDRQWHTIS